MIRAWQPGRAESGRTSMAIAARQTRFFNRLAGWGRTVSLERLESWLWKEREALVLWIPVAFGAGITAWFVLPGTAAWSGCLLMLAAVALVASGSGAASRLSARALLVGALAGFAGCLCIWWKSDRVASPVLARPVIVTFSAKVIESETLSARSAVRLLLRPDPPAMLPEQVRVSIDIDAPDARQIRPGEQLRLRARLVPPPRAALPGGYDFARRAWFDGIGAVGSAIGPVERLTPGTGRGESLREQLSRHIRSRVDGGAGAIAATLATGDRGAISAEDDEAMRRAGLAHLLSISGLHVTAAVAGAMWLSLRLLALSRRMVLRLPLVVIAAAIAALTGLGYTLLTGAEIPTIRSLLASVLVLAALAFGREAITLRLIAAGAMLVLLIWPESLIGPSFQLSFAAVTAIVALHGLPRIQAFLMRRDESVVRRLGRGLAGLLLTGIVVELALMPIALFHFHRAGVYGALANIVAIPLTTFVIMPAEALALVLDCAGLGAPAWWVVDMALSAMLAMAHWVASAPGSVTAMPTMPAAAYAMIVLGGLWLCLWQTNWRLVGGVPVAIGAIWAAGVPAPDLLVTGDGQHVAVRLEAGGYALLRARAGEFVRGQMAEAAGITEDMVPLDEQVRTRCSRDFCVWRMRRGGRDWTVMAARSTLRVDWQPLVAACAQSDIVIASRWLPRGCNPQWLKADRKSLASTGGLAIRLDPPSVTEAAASGRGKPWSTPPLIAPPRPKRPAA